ncbi:MAG: LptF/LptG family permease [Elusimicrobia bacterium]|nr:LptF/LptG family permease [Elusimicrobiota bacterium]
MTLARYLLRQFLPPFAFGLSLFSGVLLLDKIFDLIDLLVNKGVGLSLSLQIFFFVPSHHHEPERPHVDPAGLSVDLRPPIRRQRNPGPAGQRLVVPTNPLAPARLRPVAGTVVDPL